MTSKLPLQGIVTFWPSDKYTGAEDNEFGVTAHLLLKG
jgi:hypothetical protein